MAKKKIDPLRVKMALRIFTTRTEYEKRAAKLSRSLNSWRKARAAHLRAERALERYDAAAAARAAAPPKGGAERPDGGPA